MRPKINKHKNVLMIVVPSFILIILWIGFTVYRSRVDSAITQTQAVQIKPITGSFDLVTINKLKNRNKIEAILFVTPAPDEETEATSSAGTTVPVTQPEPTSTVSATITPVPTGGQL